MCEVSEKSPIGVEDSHFEGSCGDSYCTVESGDVCGSETT